MPLLATIVLATALHGQITWSGDFTVTIKALDRHLTENTNFRKDDPFNTVRMRLFPRHWVNDNLAFFGEFLFDSESALRVNGAYVIFTNLADRSWLNLKAGLIPSPFGNYGQRSTYFNQNPLIGIPLMWHYKTALPSFHYPDARQLFAELRDGRAGYAPIAYDACWDTGFELFGSYNILEYGLAITEGVLSSPSAKKNDGFQIIARLGLRPSLGARLGVSIARGPYLYLTPATAAAYPTLRAEDYNATVVGVYGEWLTGHLQLFSEVVHSQWEAPKEHIKEGKLGISSGYIEARKDFLVRWFLASRFDYLYYHPINNPDAEETAQSEASWGENLSRIEVGIAYRANRETIVKLVYQHNNYSERPTSGDPKVLAFQIHTVF